MLRRMFLAWRAIGRTFGRWVVPLFVGGFLLTGRLLGTLGTALDPLFFPDLRRAAVRRPIILLGNPRTGTTLMHRFLTEHRVGHGLQVWRMIHVSLVQQTVLRPLLPLMKRVDPTQFHASAAHETALDAVDTDDVTLLTRFFDGFFLYGFFLAFDEEDRVDLIDPTRGDKTARDLDWLDALWRRSLAWAHDPEGRIVAKLFSFGPRLPALLARYPDARVLYLARDPLAAVPSGMSLVTGVLDKLFGFWTLPEPVRRRYLDRLYRGLVELARRFEADWTSGAIDHGRVLVVRYDRLMADFDGMMAEILAFLGEEPGAELARAIEEQAAKQRGYKSAHRYDLEKFGLTAERIEADLGSWRRTFLA